MDKLTIFFWASAKGFKDLDFTHLQQMEDDMDTRSFIIDECTGKGYQVMFMENSSGGIYACIDNLKFRQR